MTEQKHAYDGSIRRRIYLFRHGDVSYVTEDGKRVGDERLVPLTPLGIDQAAHMGRFMKDTFLDRAIFTGLRRTRETAQGILSGREIALEERPDFEEIQVTNEGLATITHMNQIAYAYDEAHLPEARFIGGEKYSDFQTRVVRGLEQILAEPNWSNLALIAHGGTNRVILGWALGMGLRAGAMIEQDTCCLNIIDVDTDPETGEIVRTLVRGLNVTTYDPTRQEDHLTTLETMANHVQPKVDV
jgi:probable phosphoglycerate mutase